ncbi:hypothetical protein AAFF_G00122850 [Aldrovandia affinis]|uniref:Uncharacterized protein n=1 Tax=Aldrovandia affinis TaxID=143900 RepID=A0AAD7RRL0_9TELE|nr:hypothetical protein AAFF_G00122850 [Aldrovandia affinis]
MPPTERRKPRGAEQTLPCSAVPLSGGVLGTLPVAPNDQAARRAGEASAEERNRERYPLCTAAISQNALPDGRTRHTHLPVPILAQDTELAKPGYGTGHRTDRSESSSRRPDYVPPGVWVCPGGFDAKRVPRSAGHK